MLPAVQPTKQSDIRAACTVEQEIANTSKYFLQYNLYTFVTCQQYFHQNIYLPAKSAAKNFYRGESVTTIYQVDNLKKDKY